MQIQTELRLPFSVRFANSVNRILSWGMDPRLRTSFLAEGMADWVDMQRTEGGARVIFRALRGIPAGIWARLDEHDTTALPVAIAISVVGLGGIAAGLLERTYPTDIRRFILLSALGTLLTGVVLLREPRRIELRRLRVPTLMLSVGFFGMAATIPGVEDWAYATPPIETVLIDRAMALGFATVGFGFAMVLVASFTAAGQRVALIGGAGIVVGTAVFGCAQIAWGIAAVTTDPMITATSIFVGLAALSFIHVVPRLRRLQIVDQK